MSGNRIFVYGTLRPGGSAEARMKNGRWLGSATARGRLHRLPDYPAMVDGEGVVAGDLFEADDPETLLAELDAYEGCGPDDPEPHEYRRAQIEVIHNDVKSTAWAWLYNWPLDGATLIEDGNFIPKFNPPHAR